MKFTQEDPIVVAYRRDVLDLLDHHHMTYDEADAALPFMKVCMLANSKISDVALKLHDMHTERLNR